MSPAPRRRSKRAPAVDIVIKSPLWSSERGIKPVLRRAVAEAASAASAKDGELAIVLTDDAAIRTLNRHWRSKNKATNVLSFPAPTLLLPPQAGESRGGGPTPHYLGDIVIAYQTTAREAKAEHKPFKHHLAHLAVHGFLHLLGYDHEADAEAEAMEGLEIAVLARIRVPNPYVARDRKG
jgi:probable rRNA maturation factor